MNKEEFWESLSKPPPKKTCRTCKHGRDYSTMQQVADYDEGIKYVERKVIRTFCSISKGQNCHIFHHNPDYKIEYLWEWNGKY